MSHRRQHGRSPCDGGVGGGEQAKKRKIQFFFFFAGKQMNEHRCQQTHGAEHKGKGMEREREGKRERKKGMNKGVFCIFLFVFKQTRL